LGKFGNKIAGRKGEEIIESIGGKIEDILTIGEKSAVKWLKEF
jgi:hypothetical protein